MHAIIHAWYTTAQERMEHGQQEKEEQSSDATESQPPSAPPHGTVLADSLALS